MEVNSKENSRVLTLTLSGELDHHGARTAMEEIEFAIDAALPNAVVLDFSAVTFMDSSGIAVVLKTQRRMSVLGGSVAVEHASQQAKKVFDAAGITRVVAVNQGGTYEKQ